MSPLVKAIDRAGGGKTDEQPHRELSRRKTIRVACEWEPRNYEFVRGGLFGSNLGGGVSGEIKTEAFKIEAAEDLDSSAKASVSSGKVELERFKVRVVRPQHFWTGLSLLVLFLVHTFSLSKVFLTGGKDRFGSDPQFLLPGLWGS